MTPFDYSLCNQTVTVYRKAGEEIVRKTVRGCMHVKTAVPTENYGKSLEKTFRLIIPGNVALFPGDRVFLGTGPETVDWKTFLPVLVPELFEVSFAKPCYWEGEPVHWEAGNRKEQM